MSGSPPRAPRAAPGPQPSLPAAGSPSVVHNIFHGPVGINLGNCGTTTTGSVGAGVGHGGARGGRGNPADDSTLDALVAQLDAEEEEGAAEHDESWHEGDDDDGGASRKRKQPGDGKGRGGRGGGGAKLVWVTEIKRRVLQHQIDHHGSSLAEIKKMLEHLKAGKDGHAPIELKESTTGAYVTKMKKNAVEYQEAYQTEFTRILKLETQTEKQAKMAQLTHSMHDALGDVLDKLGYDKSLGALLYKLGELLTTKAASAAADRAREAHHQNEMRAVGKAALTGNRRHTASVQAHYDETRPTPTPKRGRQAGVADVADVADENTAPATSLSAAGSGAPSGTTHTLRAPAAAAHPATGASLAPPGALRAPAPAPAPAGAAPAANAATVDPYREARDKYRHQTATSRTNGRLSYTGTTAAVRERLNNIVSSTEEYGASNQAAMATMQQTMTSMADAVSKLTAIVVQTQAAQQSPWMPPPGWQPPPGWTPPWHNRAV